jgi:hypothetical protein
LVGEIVYFHPYRVPTHGLVFSDGEKAEAFADILELQCRPNVVDAELDHVEEIDNEVDTITQTSHQLRG